MAIAQITDIHISPDRQPVHDVDVVKNFERILRDVVSDDLIEHIVVSGDLCFEEGREDTMKWIRSKLEQSGIPYFVLPGNHDDSAIMARVFGRDEALHGSEFYYTEVLGQDSCVFLDSAAGVITDTQMTWFREVVESSDEPVLVFMHHPPVEAVPYMDRHYALAEMAAFQRELAAMSAKIAAVFCGHYHVSKCIHLDGLPPVYITPSTFFQLDDTMADFGIATKDIGWRRIDWDGERLKTVVRWLEP